MKWLCCTIYSRYWRETDTFINVGAEVYNRSLSMHIFIYENVTTYVLRENRNAKTWRPKVHFKEAFDEYMSPFVRVPTKISEKKFHAFSICNWSDSRSQNYTC